MNTPDGYKVAVIAPDGTTIDTIDLGGSKLSTIATWGNDGPYPMGSAAFGDKVRRAIAIVMLTGA